MKKGLNSDKYYWETQCCFCLLSLSSSIHWGLALTSTTNQILCLAFHISCLAFFKTDFWLFDECGVSCTQRAMRWVGSVFLQVHIIGKPLLTHVARNILFLQEILLAMNICLQWILFCSEYFFAMNIFLQWIFFCNIYFFAMNSFASAWWGSRYRHRLPGIYFFSKKYCFQEILMARNICLQWIVFALNSFASAYDGEASIDTGCKNIKELHHLLL